MALKIKYNDGTEDREENWDEIASSPAFKSMSPADRIGFMEFVHKNARVSDESGESPSAEDFFKYTNDVSSGAPMGYEKMGQKAALLANKVFLESAYSPDFQQKYDEASQTVVDFAGEKLGAPGRAMAAAPAALGKAAQEITSLGDMIPTGMLTKGGKMVGKGLTMPVGDIAPALKAGASRGMDALRAGVAKGAEAVKPAVSALKESVDMSGGVLPKGPGGYFPGPAPAGANKVPVEELDALSQKKYGIYQPSADELNAIRAQEAESRLAAVPDEEWAKGLPATEREAARMKHFEQTGGAPEGEAAWDNMYPDPKRGAVRPVSELGAKPTPKPALETTPGKVKEELVEPASDPSISPASEMPQGSQMAGDALSAVDRAAVEKAGKAELRLAADSAKAPLTKADQAAAAKAGEAELRASAQAAKEVPIQTADAAAAEAKLDSDIGLALEGKLPKDVPAPKKTNWLQRKLHGLKKGFIDRGADVRLFSEDLHDMVTQGGDASVGVFSHDVKAASSALTDNLKDASERVLWNSVYRLRSIGEMFEKTGKDYGGLGPKAAQKIEAIKAALAAKGQGAKWERINAAVEKFADATHAIGLERIRPLIGDEKAAALAQKYRYYSSFQNFDEEAAKFIKGEEGVVKNALPSMDEYATGFLKQREGSETAPLSDAFEAFQKSHWRKVVAGHKKQVVDKAVQVSQELAGKPLQREFELAGGKGWGTYKMSDGKEVPMPDVLIDFLSKADAHTSTLYSQLANSLNPIARRGYLDLNVRYYPGMVLRDIWEIPMRAPGYLTPQTEWLAKKLGAATGMTEKAPDLEYILNPAPWIRGLKASLRANFPSKYWGKTDAIFDQLEKQGALQTGSIQHVMRSESLKVLDPANPAGVVSKAANEVWEGMGKIMKSWDDTIRIGNYLRNTPKEMRGLGKMGDVLRMETLPKGTVDPAKMNAIVRNTHIDFKMMGDSMRDLKLLNPFINPAIQDKFQTLQYAKQQPASFTLTTAAMMSGAAAAYMKWKSTPEGKLLNPKDTQRFILLDTGIRSKEGGVYAMPVAQIPDSIQPIWVAIRNAIDVAYENNPEFKAILKKNYAKKTASGIAGATANISGPFVAGVETMMNYSLYLGKPIEGKYDENLSPELRAGKNVPNVFRYLGKKTGMSPDKMSYLTRGTLGAPGMGLASALDKPLAGKVQLPREGSDAPYKSPKKWLADKIKGSPKAAGLVREQKYDKTYDELQEFGGPSMRKDADARTVIRKMGERYGQEKDPATKRKYLESAIKAYREYVAGLEPDERAKVVDFEKIFTGAVTDAAKAANGEPPKSVKAIFNRFPHLQRKLGMREEKEEGQGQ